MLYSETPPMDSVRLNPPSKIFLVAVTISTIHANGFIWCFNDLKRQFRLLAVSHLLKVCRHRLHQLAQSQTSRFKYVLQTVNKSGAKNSEGKPSTGRPQGKPK